MKRIFLLIFMCLPILLMAQNKVAVYVTSTDANVDDAMKQIVGGELVAAIVQTNQYKAVERTADFLKQISKEQGYQRSGNVDDKQISAIGKQFGVNYVCVANVMPYKGSYYIQARMIEVESATVVAFAREISSNSDISSIISSSSKVARALVDIDESSNTHAVQPSVSQQSTKAEKRSPIIQDDGKIVRFSYTERKMWNINSEYYYGKTAMDRKAMAKFFQENSPESYRRFIEGNKMITAGWYLLGIGSGFTLIGGLCFLDREDVKSNFSYYAGGKWYTNTYYHGTQATDEGYVSGCFFLSLGVPSLLSSVVLLPVGHQFRKSAIDTYNGNHSQNQGSSFTLELQSSQNGIGLAFKF